MSRNRLLRGLRPMHPGEMLREDVLPALGKSKAEIARLLGISRQTLYDIIAEKQPVTPGMALRLGKLCGNGINLQRAYDLVIAERELAVEIKNIPTLTAARGGRSHIAGVLSRFDDTEDDWGPATLKKKRKKRSAS